MGAASSQESSQRSARTQRCSSQVVLGEGRSAPRQLNRHSRGIAVATAKVLAIKRLGRAEGHSAMAEVKQVQAG